MVCIRCQDGPATVHVYEVRARLERDLCERCAGDEGFVSAQSKKRFSASTLQELEALQLPILELRARIEAELRDNP